MNIGPRYLGRGSWLARRDPRTIILVVALIGITVIQIWDIRIVLLFLAGAFLWYRSANIPFEQVRRQWIFVSFFVSLIVLWNTILTSGEIGDFTQDELHVLFYLPILGTPISAEAISAEYGLGYRIFLVRRYLAMDTILPYVAWITLLAYLMDYALLRLSRWGFPWAHEARS